MSTPVGRCPECGGGPVCTLARRPHGRRDVDAVQSVCRNCGAVSEDDRPRRAGRGPGTILPSR